MHLPRHLAPFLLGLACTFIVLGLPLLLGRVPRNYWYGVRTPRTMSGTEAEWYEANRKGGMAMVAIGLLMLVVAVALSFISH